MINGKNIAYLVLLAALIFFVQCSPTQKHKALTMVFDGVPDTGAVVVVAKKSNFTRKPLVGSDSLAKANLSGSKFILHKPYKEHLCEKCHDDNNIGEFLKPMPELCYTCHESFEKKYAYVHGPVSNGYCLVCHSPHLSENKKLLTRLNEQVCFYCHNSEIVLQSKNHEGLNISVCTSCHNPHGGKNRYLTN